MTKGVIFDIQGYSLYDGPGIRTSVYLKGCPLRCKWCHNPESQSFSPEMAWSEQKCTQCMACVDACEQGALKLTGGKIERDNSSCNVCGMCSSACPNEAMEKIGWEATPEEVLQKVMPDRPFYEESGGGVTITGGEPSASREFLLETLGLLKKSGIHTAVETCGYFNDDLIPDLAEKVDLFLYDIKHADTTGHCGGTGVDNGVILENFKALLGRVGSERVIPRVPLVPGFNTDEESIRGIVDFLKNSGYDGPAHLMPWHGTARGKYDKLGRGDEFYNCGELDPEQAAAIAKLFRDRGFESVLYGE